MSWRVSFEHGTRRASPSQLDTLTCRLPRHLTSPTLRLGTRSCHSSLRYGPYPSIFFHIPRTVHTSSDRTDRCSAGTICLALYVPYTPPSLYTSLAAGSNALGGACASSCLLGHILASRQQYGPCPSLFVLVLPLVPRSSHSTVHFNSSEAAPSGFLSTSPGQGTRIFFSVWILISLVSVRPFQHISSSDLSNLVTFNFARSTRST
jgi:hypothetical protein